MAKKDDHKETQTVQFIDSKASVIFIGLSDDPQSIYGLGSICHQISVDPGASNGIKTNTLCKIHYTLLHHGINIQH